MLKAALLMVSATRARLTAPLRSSKDIRSTLKPSELHLIHQKERDLLGNLLKMATRIPWTLQSPSSTGLNYLLPTNRHTSDNSSTTICSALVIATIQHGTNVITDLLVRQSKCT